MAEANQRGIYVQLKSEKPKAFALEHGYPLPKAVNVRVLSSEEIDKYCAATGAKPGCVRALNIVGSYNLNL
jgi:hypothetical protein